MHRNNSAFRVKAKEEIEGVVVYPFCPSPSDCSILFPRMHGRTGLMYGGVVAWKQKTPNCHHLEVNG